ncbi:MAG: hypothetical protein ACOCSQ_00985 [Planctomycetota bacterium]
MEYVALLLWLFICLTLGAAMHKLLSSVNSSNWMKWIAAPGVIVRKFAMSIAAMATGSTVTNVNVYHTSDRDIGFDSRALGGLPRFLVAVAPLFLAAVVLQTVNAFLGAPINPDLTEPIFAELSLEGAGEFFSSFWHLVSELVRDVGDGEWSNIGFYVFLGLALSLSLGASSAFARFKESLFGALLIVVCLAILCSIFGVPASGLSSLTGKHPAVSIVETIREFIFETAHFALIMMLCGMIMATVIGTIVRLFELLTSSRGDATSAGTGGN